MQQYAFPGLVVHKIEHEKFIKTISFYTERSMPVNLLCQSKLPTILKTGLSNIFLFLTKNTLHF